MSPDLTPEQIEETISSCREQARRQHETACDLLGRGHIAGRMVCACGVSHVGSCTSKLCTSYRDLAQVIRQLQREKQELEKKLASAEWDGLSMCPDCGATFDTIFAWKLHRQRNHPKA